MLKALGPEKVRPATAGRYVAVGLVLAGALAAAQAPAPSQPTSPPTPEVTFKVEVNYVEEDVRVVDKDGNFVRGLKQEDFQVLEDGKPQKVQTFGMVDIPEHAPAQALVPRSERAADRARRGGQQAGARRALVPDGAR